MSVPGSGWSRRWMTGVTALVAGLGGLSLGVSSNALYSYVAGLLNGNDRANATNLRVALGAVVAAIVCAGVLVPLLRRVFTPRFPGQRSAEFSQVVPPRRAVVALVSLPRQNGGNPAETAILYHLQGRDAGGEKVEHCWLLYTPEGASEFQRLREEFLAVNCHEMLLDGRAKEDPSFTYRAVRGAFEAAQAQGLRPEQVIADATGGTKPMTIGMALACRELNLSMEYIAADYVDNRPALDKAQVIEVKMSGAHTGPAHAAASVLPHSATAARSASMLSS